MSGRERPACAGRTQHGAYSHWEDLCGTYSHWEASAWNLHPLGGLHVESTPTGRTQNGAYSHWEDLCGTYSHWEDSV